MSAKKPARWLWTLVALLIVPACAGNSDDPIIAQIVALQARIQLGFLGRYNTGLFNAGGAEIPAYDPGTKRLFVINAGPSTVDVIDLTDPKVPVLVTSINCLIYGGGANTAGSPNSVAVSNGLVAIAVQSTVKTDNGEVVFFAANDAFGFTTPLRQMAVGAVPDMLCFSPNGLRVLVANEGEPTTGTYAVDPEGSVSIITLTDVGPAGVAAATSATASFTSFNSQKAALKAAGVRIIGKDVGGLEPDGVAPVSLDLEPEYIAVSADSSTAWVTLQENNAFAIINIATATVTKIVPLGYKDHSLAKNSLDPCDRELPGNLPLIQFVTGPVRGLYMPDAIASFAIDGKTYLITANEGDARDYATAVPTPFQEEARISTLALDATVFPTAAALKANTSFGRLNVTKTLGDIDLDGDYDALYSFGARSVSIWDANGAQVWDSGDDIERVTAAALPLNFNATHDSSNNLDDRSDNKGPEPEGVTIGVIDGRTYAFICLERVGGIIVYDVTSPSSPVFQTYINTRDFRVAPSAGVGPGQPVNGLDLGPEGLTFVSAANSPNGKPLLIVAHEISGSTVIFQVTKLFN